MSEIENLAATVCAVARPGAKPKEIVAAVREKHPEASRKDVVRAAFYALTDGTSDDPERHKNLHSFAISERASVGSPDDELGKAKKPQKAARSSKAPKAKA
ncbi:hypothetical protein [Aurantimonas endophytica]|uniref:Uncharacterized protein n=1 Tax=Aurantimonas endophytica TaxID=1522175 RepID=A0A7W6HI11_9HYPH|nr:hypothetical protein [Aurantimonas endophytica]MBB4005561.1 hypothetical protein [Aurantimonas endophytica]MCO6406469.1 hypothetical protein [Aurantimonas endophytica]